MNSRLIFSRPVLDQKTGRWIVVGLYKTSKNRTVKVTVDLEKAIVDDAIKNLRDRVSNHLQITERGIEVGALPISGFQKLAQAQAQLVHPSVHSIVGAIELRPMRKVRKGLMVNIPRDEIGYGFDEIGWNPFSAIGDAVSSVANAVVDTVSTAVNVATAPVQAIVTGVTNALPLPAPIKGIINGTVNQAISTVQKGIGVSREVANAAAKLAAVDPEGAAQQLAQAAKGTGNLAIEQIRSAVKQSTASLAVVKKITDDPRFKALCSVASFVPGPWQPIAAGLSSAMAIEQTGRALLSAISNKDPKAVVTLAATLGAAQMGDPKAKEIVGVVYDLIDRGKALQVASGGNPVMNEQQFITFLNNVKRPVIMEHAKRI